MPPKCLQTNYSKSKLEKIIQSKNSLWLDWKVASITFWFQGTWRLQIWTRPREWLVIEKFHDPVPSAVEMSSRLCSSLLGNESVVSPIRPNTRPARVGISEKELGHDTRPALRAKCSTSARPNPSASASLLFSLQATLGFAQWPSKNAGKKLKVDAERGLCTTPNNDYFVSRMKS